MYKSHVFTSESVTEGHPDKMADQISDAILDAYLSDDENSRVACETLLTTDLVVVAGEITSNAYVDICKTVRNVVKDIGYTSHEIGFAYDTCKILNCVHRQSEDIANGVNENKAIGKGLGAGDQGLMFGYATNETEEFMPTSIVLANKLSKRLTDVRKNGILDYLCPDGKSQVTYDYVTKKVTEVVLSTQHYDVVSLDKLREDMKEYVIKPIIGEDLDNVRLHINPAGKFITGGPDGDTGLTGRKIIVDTYGGMARHGGGAFSGKDPTKVDRSAAYMMRYIAKNIVAANLCDKCEIEVAYAIGESQPVSIMVDTFCTNNCISEGKIVDIIYKVFDLSPEAIIEQLDLRIPRYRQTAAYGHFGREEFPWEKTDKVEAIKASL